MFLVFLNIMRNYYIKKSTFYINKCNVKCKCKNLMYVINRY